MASHGTVFFAGCQSPGARARRSARVAQLARESNGYAGVKGGRRNAQRNRERAGHRTAARTP